ncbi:MAG: integration host factor subunit beta [Spirochaetes bacterium]|nr:integration host factor subunit beta [Spirochaetota bacterium]
MTKSEIAQRLTIQSGLRKKEVLYIIDNFLEKIKDSVRNGEKVEIRGFGTFYQNEKKARSVYSPIAGKTIDVPAKFTLAFKASKQNGREYPESDD